MMMFSSRGICILLVFFCMFMAACAPKEYTQAVLQAEHFENLQDYEKAYQYYQKALESHPNDAKAMAKIQELSKVISQTYTSSAVQAFNDKKFKSSIDLFDKAIEYDPGNEPAMEYRQMAMDQYNQIQALYTSAESYASQNHWIEAVETLNSIAASYTEDQNLEALIQKYTEDGHAYYMKSGFNARKAGQYNQSQKFFELAQQLRPEEDSLKALEAASGYMEAEKRYIAAKKYVKQDNILAAMDELLLAKEVVSDHAEINQMIEALAPAWSSLIFQEGEMLFASGRQNEAFEAFSKLYLVNPTYPEAENFYNQTKDGYLKFNYTNLVQAYKDSEFKVVSEYLEKIWRIDASFLDTRDIMMRALRKRFNMYFQKGLHFLKNKNSGKAVLCFKSAEKVLAPSQLTGELIEKSWANIRESSALQVAIWDFFEQVDDSSIRGYGTDKLKELMKQRVDHQPFKNIHFNFEDASINERSHRMGFNNQVDWGLLSTSGYNAVIIGDINSLGLEKSINSEWKVRKRKVRRIIDNEQYARLDIRKAELKQALKDSSKKVFAPNEKYTKLLQKRDATHAELSSATLSDTKKRRLEKELVNVEKKIASTPEMIPMRASEMQREIREIEKTLEITPQKIEAEIDEEIPYQVTNHAIDVRIRLNLRIANRGMELWPPTEYEEVFRIEDSVVPPNLMAEDPDERMGDPLTLPNDSDAKKMAIENLVEKKVYPDLIQSFENYGIRFYEIATKINTDEADSYFSSVEFLDSIEEYFKFLACYDNKGASDGDDLIEQVQKKIDSLILSSWLLNGPEPRSSLPNDG